MSKAAVVEPKVSTRPEDERLPVGKAAAFGLQHVLTMYGGIIAVPIIIGNAAGLAPEQTALLVTSGLFIGGLATILQSWGAPFLGAKLPLVQGVSFAGVATMLAILNGGGDLSTVFGAVIGASILGFLAAPFFAKVIRFFPPVVTGTIITCIGLSLIPVAGRWIMGPPAGEEGHGSLTNILLALGTLVLIMALSKVGSAAISRLSILLGIVVGTVVAAFMGMVTMPNLADTAPVAIPTPFAFGMPTFDIAAILSMTIVVLDIMTETTADIIAVGEIIDTPVDSRRIADGLRADMLSSALAPVFNSFTQSAFAQNVGLVAISGIKSRFVVTAGGVIMLVLGLLPGLGAIVAAIPSPVLGGAGIVLFGTVAASGIRSLAKVKFEGNMNLVIVAVSVGFGMLPVVIPAVYDNFPAWFGTIFESGISSAAIMAVILNIVFNEIKVGNTENQSVFAARPIRFLSPDNLHALEEGDTFVDGKLVDKEGNEIPIVPASKVDEVRQKIDAGEITDTSQIVMICKVDDPDGCVTMDEYEAQQEAREAKTDEQDPKA
ncbi:nucleobase:cation symporter-2 family protein [Micrococcoides hystricis]|uniref:Nucleobase:cation symporter-2 family protein n=1 Tax=Micrococcoides hystricis TaxID=1572761 RepID=A0ABV6PCP2_9MICC